MTSKQRDAKAASKGNKAFFIELMGYDVEITGIPKTWKECVERFK